MAQGKPMKWITARIAEPIHLGNSGIEVIVWDKWVKTRRGTATISVGGSRWRGYKMKKAIRIPWEKLQDFAEG
jgi:hypothetical protein